ncbi:SDR family oxidoreductase [Mycobacterium cookii]|uniref:Oxidoreductase n=1 Tax=Mycobacterium cookii TaxID=1775 RepID=A0A7I7L0W2_9MYCO|nr:SDR family oxidoreductase [Mycobacterium cookii]MCV7330604.1 SDR family oxidoreductase [Mycobacterium cookii]BBX47202.1 oxidoreductase [Mycobacterium cookii]
MSPSLAGQVAIVTGGASGLGRGIVEGFIKAGAEVVIADVNDKLGQDLAHSCGPRAHYSHADVANADNVSTLILETTERLGGLDVMVNNAGISTRMHRSFLEDDLADFSKVMAVNLFGVMLGTRESARYMSTHGGGAIINIASIGGLQAGGGVMTYRASKAAVIHFSKSVATELGPKGISVNCIAPGGIPTPILASSVQGLGLSEEAVDKFVDKTRTRMRNDRPLPHEGTPEDVAEAALYLAASPGTTGAVLTVDGGTSATA